ncbi:MAG: hypothetical protein WCV50_01940 [Patescibacteria group bacterium]|jgi:hypothetical protein
MSKLAEEYLSWEETEGKKIRSYTTLDCNSKEVLVCPKNPSKHSSHHRLDNDPTVFYNLKNVISHPNKIIKSKSENPISKQHKKTGKIIVYTKKNFIEELNLPGGNQIGDVDVVVKYGDKETGKNFTLTYIIKPASEKLS